jgi:para-nitrobenzyl esterase
MPAALLDRLLPMTARLYPDLSKQKDAPARIRSDWVFSAPARFMARSHAGHGAATYRYLFDYVSVGAEPPEEGEEGQEIRFVFGTLGVRAGPYSQRDREVSNTMRTYWTNFAKHGDPNGPDVPAWRPQSERDDLLLISKSGITSGPDPMKERLDLMEQVTSRPRG